MINLFRNIALLLLVNLIVTSAQSQTEKVHINAYCRKLYDCTGVESPGQCFEYAIVKKYGNKEPKELNQSQIADIVSQFLNENQNVLICGNDTHVKIRDKEHILKRSIAYHGPHFLRRILETEEYAGKVNYNFYEIIDGKKETILDFIDKILDDEDLMHVYDKEELEDFIDMIEYSGGKRGSEL